MCKASQPIGIFDSGLGGLTVMKQIVALLPDEEIVYYGDTARLPYGSKSPDTIERYSKENASFLLGQNVKSIVIACNTASAFALDVLARDVPIPVLGVIAPGARKAVEVSQSARIAVLATKATVASGAYERAILSLCPDAEITQIACPLFVPFIEEGLVHHQAMKLLLEDYLKPIQKKNIDTVLLGCTHYPLLLDVLSDYLGGGIAIVDSATACAEELKMILHLNGLSRKLPESVSHKYFVSDAPNDFVRLSKHFLGMEISQLKVSSVFSEK